MEHFSLYSSCRSGLRGVCGKVQYRTLRVKHKKPTSQQSLFQTKGSKEKNDRGENLKKKWLVLFCPFLLLLFFFFQEEGMRDLGLGNNSHVLLLSYFYCFCFVWGNGAVLYIPHVEVEVNDWFCLSCSFGHCCCCCIYIFYEVISNNIDYNNIYFSLIVNVTVVYQLSRLYIEGSRPEWCISSIIYTSSRDTPFWFETLDMRIPHFSFFFLRSFSVFLSFFYSCSKNFQHVRVRGVRGSVNFFFILKVFFRAWCVKEKFWNKKLWTNWSERSLAWP